jgi:hypothetical protein
MSVYPLHVPSATSANVLSQAPDAFTRHTVRPDDIRPGDWLRDLGTLRQVVSVETLPAMASTQRIFVVHFEPVPDVDDLALGIPASVMVTLWRAA